MLKTTLLIFLCTLLGRLPARATNYYVSPPTNQPAGNDNHPGTLAQPFATLERATGVVGPGDTVFVRGGTYTNRCSECVMSYITKSGTPSQWIVFRNYPGEQPLLKIDGYTAFTLEKGAAYIEIRGFRIQGPTASQRLADAQQQNQSCDDTGAIRPGPAEPRFNTHGIVANGANPATSGTRPHHMRFVGNEIFECGASGISTVQCDYVTIENNLIYNNSWHTVSATSGISLYQSWNFDTAPGYHNVIRGNRSFGNRVFVKWNASCTISDGNGIIIDDSRNTQNNSTLGAYTGRTLVANNIVAGNGGSGIHSFESEHIDIVNNTAYQNSQSPELDNGEIFAVSSNDILIQNNILVPLAGNVVNVDFQNTNFITRNNLHFGGTREAVPGTATVRADPQVVHASTDWRTADFHLQASSPAIDQGLATQAPTTDYDGRPRPQGARHDIGAFEFGGGPGTPAAVSNGTYQLLARHSGKALDVDRGGTANGNRVQQWTPNNSAAQQWQIEAVGGGYYKLTALCSGKVLDVNGYSAADGAVVHQWHYLNQANQQWAIEPTTGGYYKLIARHSGKALDVSGSSTADGGGVQQWQYGGPANQQWKLHLLSGGQKALKNSAASAEPVSLSVYPNPAATVVELRFTAPKAQAVTVSITDLAGRRVLHQTHQATAGANQLTVPLRLAKGVYAVSVQEAGARIVHKLIVE